MKRRVLATGIVLVWGGLTYHPDWGWWISAAAAGGILVLAMAAWPNAWAERLWLAMGLRGALLFAAALALTVAGTEALVPWLGARGGHHVGLSDLGAMPRSVHFTVYQTLNEEMVAGALLLFALDRRFPGRRGRVAAGVAAALAAASFELYRHRFSGVSTGGGARPGRTGGPTGSPRT